MNKSESIKELATALAKFQNEVTNPQNSKTVSAGKFSYKYAPLDEILSLVRPILAKNELSIVQVPTMSDGMVGVTTTLLHSSGEWIETNPILLKLDKQSAQGAGSAITYARRYAISSILGISSEDDDDANSIEPESLNKKENKNDNTNKTTKKNLSDKQISRLYAIASSASIDADTVKDQVKRKYSKEVSELNKEEYDTVCNGYENFKK